MIRCALASWLSRYTLTLDRDVQQTSDGGIMSNQLIWSKIGLIRLVNKSQLMVTMGDHAPYAIRELLREANDFVTAPSVDVISAKLEAPCTTWALILSGYDIVALSRATQSKNIPDTYIVNDVFVRQGWRRKGLGTIAMRRLQNEIRLRRMSGQRLQRFRVVLYPHQRMDSFYFGLGYEVVGRWIENGALLLKKNVMGPP